MIQKGFVITFLEDIYTPFEKTMISGGHDQHVMDGRFAFQQMMRQTYADIIETVTGRKVRAFLSQNNIDPAYRRGDLRPRLRSRRRDQRRTTQRDLGRPRGLGDDVRSPRRRDRARGETRRLSRPTRSSSTALVAPRNRERSMDRRRRVSTHVAQRVISCLFSKLQTRRGYETGTSAWAHGGTRGHGRHASKARFAGVAGISHQALELLRHYDWPGNIRELENVMERAVALEPTPTILPDSLPRASGANAPQVPTATARGTAEAGFDLEAHVKEIERGYIAEALKRAGGVQVKAAELLGMSFRSFRYYVKKYNLR